MIDQDSTAEQPVIAEKTAKKKRKFYHKRFWLYFAMVIVLGLAVNFLLPQIKSLENSWSVVKNLTWWALILAAIVQVCSYLCAGFMIHAILDANGQQLSVWKGALIYMASYSVSLVAGGWVAGAAATVGWVKNEARDGKTTLLAGALPSLYINATLTGLALFGIIYLLIIHDLTKGQLIQYLIYLLILSAITYGELLALRFPRKASSIWIAIANRWAKLSHKPFDSQSIIEKMDNFALAWHTLRGHRWIKPYLGALGFLACDMLTLFFLFIAAGYTLSPGILLAGYSLPLLLSKVLFLFPGGVGIIEVTMIALFSNLTKARQISLVGILAYRLFSFWIPTISGFFLAAYFSRKALKRTPRNRNRMKEVASSSFELPLPPSEP